MPQMVEQLLDVMRFFDFLLPVPEQVIEVPKILLDDVPMRSAVRDTQLAEQLVVVPTIVSYSWLQLRMEQNVDIPVPGRVRGISGLQGFLPGQSSTAMPSSKERISERTVEQNVEFPVGGGLQDFLPGHSSSASSSSPAGVRGSADGLVEEIFRTFPKIKKNSDVGLALGVGTAPRVEPGRWRRRLDPHRLRAWAVLEEAAVGPRSVAPAVGSTLTAARRLRGVALVGTVSVTHQRQVPAVFDELVDGASSIHRQSGGSCRYSTETGRRHPCHGAVADSFGPIAIEIPQLQYIDQVFDVLVAQVQQIRAKSWETVEIPQLQLDFSWTSCCSLVVCNDTCPWSMSFAVHRRL